MEQNAFGKLYKARQGIKKLKFIYPGLAKRENLVEWSPTSPLPLRCTA